MVFRFDLTRLDFPYRESLRKILDVIQSENVGEIVVEVIEFPDKFLVLADDIVELLWGLAGRSQAVRQGDRRMSKRIAGKCRR